MDQLNPHRYIELSKYFDIIADEKKAELLDIAYRLGAKHCHLECREEKRSIVSGRPRESERRNSKSMMYPSRRRIRGEVEAEFENMALP